MPQPPVAESATIPDAQDVASFCRVVDLGSITAAAQALGETKGAVSRRVTRLESRLGTSLLRRTGRRVEPTEEGRLYREQAGRALELLAEAGVAVRAAEAEPSGLLRITAPMGVAAPLLGEVLPSFLERFSAVRVEVIVTDAVLSFRDHQVDVALRFAQSLPDSSLVAHRLFQTEPTLVASPTYLARRGRPGHPRDLDGHDILAIPAAPALRPTFVRGDEVVRVNLRPRLASHDAALLVQLAIAGAGLTALLPHFADAELADGRLVPVLDGWTMRTDAALYLLHAGGVLPPAVRAFRDHLRGWAGCDGRQARS